MKSINKWQFLFIFGFLLIVTCTLTSKAYGQTVEVISQDAFSTVNPPKEITIKLAEPLIMSVEDTYTAGTLLKGNLTDVVSPKRLKKNADFTFVPTVAYDSQGTEKSIKSGITASFTQPIDKTNLAKNIVLGIGNFFVKGLSMGVAAITGAVKNEEKNRIKSSANAVYEASPLSYVEKGEDIYIKKDDHFFLKFKPKKEDVNTDEANVIKGQNYSYTTEKE